MARQSNHGSSRWDRFQSVTPYLRKYRYYLILGGVAVIFANGLLLAIPYLTKVIFDLLEQSAPSQEIGYYVLLSIGLAVGAGIFRFALRRTVIWMSRLIEYHLRGDLFRHLLELSPSFYHSTRTGDIMARAINDLEAVRMMIGPGIMHLANTLVSVVVALAMMLVLSPMLTLYAVVPMILFPIVFNRIGNLIHSRFVRVQKHFATLNATAQENLAGVRVIKAYRQEEAEVDFFATVSLKYLTLNMDLARLHAIFLPLLLFMATALNLVALYFGGLEVISGAIPLGTMVAFFAYLTMLFWPMMALGWVISLYQRGTASLDRINEILDSVPEVRNHQEDLHKGKMTGRIELKNLSFAYGDAPVLDGINLTIEPGWTVGLVGPTGCGKTTLVDLLVRLYPIGRGCILIDGIDINDWDLASLRKQIGFATQEPFLFSDTIEDNIRFGRSSAAHDEVTAATRVAALDKDVESFPAGYQTMVGERGITLSGGQKQRTAIARALIIDPALLVLDDATSSVDTETEDQINVRIKSLLKGRTAIIISHRVSSVKEADMIAYLDNGKIVEQGNHEELLKLNGSYAELYRAQLLRERLEKF